MIIKVTRKLNEFATATFEVDEKDTDLSLLQMAFFAEEPRCWLKGFEEAMVKWNVRKAGGNGEYTYVEMTARTKDGRRANRTAGKYKNGGMFWKSWEESVKGTDGKWSKVTGTTPQKVSQTISTSISEIEYPTEQIDVNDIPFN